MRQALLLLLCTFALATTAAPADRGEFYDRNCVELVAGRFISVAARLALYENDFPPDVPNIGALRRLVENEAEYLRLHGAHTWAAVDQAVLVWRESRHQSLTPRRLDALYKLQRQEAKYLVSAAQGPDTIVTPVSIGIVAHDSHHQGFVDRFNATKVPIHLLDLEGARAFFRSPFIDELIEETDVHELRHSIERDILLCRAQSLRGYGKRPPAITKLLYHNGRSARLDVVHEMAHALQNAEWNHQTILDFFLKALHPELRTVKSLLPTGLFHMRFLGAPFRQVDYPNYRATDPTNANNSQGVMERAESEMTVLDWTVFSDFLRIFQEIDSIAWERSWDRHLGINFDRLSEEIAFNHLLSHYVNTELITRISGEVIFRRRSEIFDFYRSFVKP